MSPSLTSLLDLPNELLLVISEDLDVDSLVDLAATCERLYSVLIPGICDLFGLEIPPSSRVLPSLAVTGETLKLLRVIGIAAFIKSIDALNCDFAWQISRSAYVSPPFSDVLRAASSLTSLAIRLSHLGHLRLNPYATVHSRQDLVSWLQALAAVLNSAAQRNCTVTVYGVPGPDYDADPRPFLHFIPEVPRITIMKPTPRPPPKSFVLAILQKLMPFFRPTPKSVKLPKPPKPIAGFTLRHIAPIQRQTVTMVPVPSYPLLTTLNIHSSFLFHAAFYKWTVYTLNTAPITTLSLSHIDLLHFDWLITLPKLALPGLTSLKIGQECAIAVPDLTLFLTRHPTITTLDLSWHVAIGALTPPLANRSTLPLPRLESLCALPDYVLYFLDGASVENDEEEAYPALQRVTVISNDSSSPYERKRLRELLKCVEKRRASVPVVELIRRLRPPEAE
ncbi:hypothetical protein DFH08DRAFT_859015 [Mycena albidolilacea]|uniref:F-box domain-containing protein n=1 Tax=Mycena albidolilacea TaxID=1033008 RepID=A0AAD7A936_9AGAR|nr:hypothetical protein DFH08DRAFT_859015 [Mycena albidolilacea]